MNGGQLVRDCGQRRRGCRVSVHDRRRAGRRVYRQVQRELAGRTERRIGRGAVQAVNADLLGSHLQRERILILLSTSFAGIALVLVAVGLFGILTRSVSLRTREIGIRMALGERRSSVIRKMLLSSLRLVAVGVVIGSFLAYAGSRLLQALLYQTSIGSPWVYVAAGALLFATAALAAILPANRAASIEPGEALRME